MYYEHVGPQNHYLPANIKKRKRKKEKEKEIKRERKRKRIINKSNKKIDREREGKRKQEDASSSLSSNCIQTLSLSFFSIFFFFSTGGLAVQDTGAH
jgi:hypothetical protein